MEETNRNGSPLRCFLGVHAYRIHSEQPLTDGRGGAVGIVIVNRCACCGKIKDTRINTVSNGGY